jgi:hypothetical protein
MGRRRRPPTPEVKVAVRAADGLSMRAQALVWLGGMLGAFALGAHEPLWAAVGAAIAWLGLRRAGEG